MPPTSSHTICRHTHTQPGALFPLLKIHLSCKYTSLARSVASWLQLWLLPSSDTQSERRKITMKIAAPSIGIIAVKHAERPLKFCLSQSASCLSLSLSLSLSLFGLCGQRNGNFVSTT